MSSSASPNAPGADFSQRRKVWSSAVGSMMGSGLTGDCRACDGATKATDNASASKLLAERPDKELIWRWNVVTEIFSTLRLGFAEGESLRRKWAFVNNERFGTVARGENEGLRRPGNE